MICCGCLDCSKFCRDFDNHKDNRRCHLTWYFVKRGCCSFFFCKSGSQRGKCLCGHYKGERCGGCISCRKLCTCGWPGNCESKETSCCGCCICLCCIQEDQEAFEVSVDVNKKMSGPPAFHLGTKHKVESETTRKFDPDEHRPLPPISGEIENKQKNRPQPPPPEYSSVKDQNIQRLSANNDDTRGLSNDMLMSSRLPPHLAPIQPALEQEVALKEPKKKKKKKKKKDQLNEGDPEK